MNYGLKLMKAERIPKKWPMFFYQFFCVLPSEEQTRKAQEKAATSLVPSHSEIAMLAKDFSEGKVKKGSVVTLQGVNYVFLGAEPKYALVLEMFWFLDPEENEFCRLQYSYDGKRPV